MEMIRNFLKAVGYKFIISEGGSHMSASVFADDAELVFNMSRATVQEMFLEEVDKIPYLGGRGTNMDAALRLVADEVFTLDGFTRQKAPKVLVMLTSGNCNRCREPLSEAVKPLKEAGVSIVTIPIGKNTNRQELEAMSSLPTSQYVIPQDSFTELLNGVFIQKVNTIICSGKPGVCEQVERPESCPETIQFDCEVDVDCPGSEKCCLQGCDKSCVAPVAGKFTCVIFPFSRNFSRFMKHIP